MFFKFETCVLMEDKPPDSHLLLQPAFLDCALMCHHQQLKQHARTVAIFPSNAVIVLAVTATGEEDPTFTFAQ